MPGTELSPPLSILDLNGLHFELHPRRRPEPNHRTVDIEAEAGASDALFIINSVIVRHHRFAIAKSPQTRNITY